jgi:ADP-ribosylglycohydrolase
MTRRRAFHPAVLSPGLKEEAAPHSRKISEITHNHSKKVKGAEAVSVGILMARKRYAKNS